MQPMNWQTYTSAESRALFFSYLFFKINLQSLLIFYILSNDSSIPFYTHVYVYTYYIKRLIIKMNFFVVNLKAEDLSFFIYVNLIVVTNRQLVPCQTRGDIKDECWIPEDGWSAPHKRLIAENRSSLGRALPRRKCAQAVTAERITRCRVDIVLSCWKEMQDYAEQLDNPNYVPWHDSEDFPR